MEYIAAADSLLRGEGFLNFQGEVYILWPPLYPLLLAGAHLLSGLDVIAAGWVLNALAQGATVLLTGVVMRLCFPDTLIWPAFGAFLSVVSVSYLSLASNIASDTLFTLMALAFFIACQRYLVTSSRGWLAAMLVLAALAPLQRFLGVCVVATGALVVLVQYRKQPLKALVGAVVFGILASLPTLLWVLGRNYALYGNLTGPRHLQDAFPLLNLAYCTRMLLRWFVPLSVINRLPLWVIPALLLAVLLLLGRQRHWVAFLRRIALPEQWPMMVFSALYLLIIILTTITFDHTHPYDDRFQSVIYAPFLVFNFTLLQELVLAPLRERGLRLAQPLAALLLLVWTIYPLSILREYVQQSLREGEAIYNLYNARTYLESPVVRYLRANPLERDVQVYSNDPEAAYLLTRSTTLYSPRDRYDQSRSDENLHAQYRGWPEEGKAYLIWFFVRGDRRNFFTPADLEEITGIETLFAVPQGGGVYRIQGR
jgi:hypothetical protein